jgi:hypothetical protein
MKLFSLICFCIIGSAMAQAEESTGYKLARDPFVVPKSVLVATSPILAPKEKPEAEILFNSMVLRSVVKAGKNSLVNVDGKIIAMGEKLEGYKLVQVGNAEAVFENNGRRQTLKMEREQKP